MRLLGSTLLLLSLQSLLAICQQTPNVANPGGSAPGGGSASGVPAGTPEPTVPGPAPGQQVMFPLFYSTSGFSKGIRNLSQLKCGVYIQTDEPKPGSGIQLQVAPKSDTDKTLVFTQTPAAQPVGQIGRKYKSGLIQKADLGNALQYAKLEPVKQLNPGQTAPNVWTKVNCMNWSMSFADNLHVRGLMRNTDFTKLSNLMNQWTLMTLPLALGAHPAAIFAFKWYKKNRAKKMAALKAAQEGHSPYGGHEQGGEHDGTHENHGAHGAGATDDTAHRIDGDAHPPNGAPPPKKMPAWEGPKTWLTGALRHGKTPQPAAAQQPQQGGETQRHGGVNTQSSHGGVSLSITQSESTLATTGKKLEEARPKVARRWARQGEGERGAGWWRW